jgi:hypothetical protein
MSFTKPERSLPCLKTAHTYHKPHEFNPDHQTKFIQASYYYYYYNHNHNHHHYHHHHHHHHHQYNRRSHRHRIYG